MPIELSSPAKLSASEISDVRALADTVAIEDRQPALTDQALTRLGGDTVEHSVARDDGVLVGYGQLDGDSLEIVGRTDSLVPLLDRYTGRELLIWTHGQNSRLSPVLADRGFERVRTLHQLRRRLADPIDDTDLPAGLEIRAFMVGLDEPDWVRVNAAAFAHHREQGSWTRSDLEARESEPWFDPSGFLLAWRGVDLAGFHWTKVHPDGLGEVYVIGVDPSGQGSGLGKVLLQRGLAHLRERGCPLVLLYVDADNIAAMQLYERFGFTQFDLDAQWRSS